MMKPFLRFLGCVAVLSICAVASASELTINLKANNESLGEIRLQLKGDFATATVAESTEEFNLKEMSWLDEKGAKWVSLAQCRDWAEQSKAKSKKSADSVPAHIRPFILWSLEPTFTVRRTSDTLKLTSGQVDYVVAGETSKTDVDAYFRYAVLNAYKKAMSEKKLPPFAELKAIDEMRSLGRIPKRITVTIPGVPGAPTMELGISETKP